jgi:hypothetical protein
LNCIRPVAANNPKLPDYLKAADRLIAGVKKKG